MTSRSPLITYTRIQDLGGRSWVWNYNLNLIGQDRLPVGEQFTALPPGSPSGLPIATNLRTWTWNYNPNLVGQDQFPPGAEITVLSPRGYEYAALLKTWTQNLLLSTFSILPAGSKVTFVPPTAYPEPATRTWIWDYNPNLVGQDQFPTGVEVTSLTPRGPAQPDHSWVVGLNLALTTGPVALPFNQDYWPLTPAAMQPDRTWTWNYNPNLIGQDAFPPGQALIKLPPLVVEISSNLRTWIETLNLSLNVVVVTLPFNQYNWPLTPIAVQPDRTWAKNYNLNLIGQDRLPFNQYNWPLPKQPLQPVQIWTWSYNVNLIGQDFFPPGARVTDLSPRGPQISAQLRTWLSSLSLPLNVVVVNLPPGVQKFELPVRLTTFTGATWFGLQNVLLYPGGPVVPILPPGHQANYFFRFGSEMLARIDPIVGPYLLLPGRLLSVFVYDTRTGFALGDWWCCVVQKNPLSINLLTHPNLQFALDREAQFKPGPSVIVNNIGATLVNLEITVAEGVYANKGLH